jgi:hypothetical protein
MCEIRYGGQIPAKYRAKRDLAETAEPSGGAEVRQAKNYVSSSRSMRRRIALRPKLELDGVFKSRAVRAQTPDGKRLGAFAQQALVQE